MAPGPSLITDVSGNPLAGTFGKTLPTTNVFGENTGQSAGLAAGGIGPSGQLTPLTIDAYGALTIRPGVCPTWTATSTANVATGTGAGKSMLSVFNASQKNWMRIAAIFATCPPQINTQGGLLGIGSGTSYMQVPFGVFRMAGHAGGTLLTKVAADPSDDASIDPACTVRVGATISGLAAAPNYVWDAAYNGSLPVGPRPDLCMKVWTMPPGYGFSINNLNALGGTVGFLMSITCAQNIA